jgi:hypothetical protein
MDALNLRDTGRLAFTETLGEDEKRYRPIGLSASK